MDKIGTSNPSGVDSDPSRPNVTGVEGPLTLEMDGLGSPTERSLVSSYLYPVPFVRSWVLLFSLVFLRDPTHQLWSTETTSVSRTPHEYDLRSPLLRANTDPVL